MNAFFWISVNGKSKLRMWWRVDDGSGSDDGDGCCCFWRIDFRDKASLCDSFRSFVGVD